MQPSTRLLALFLACSALVLLFTSCGSDEKTSFVEAAKAVVNKPAPEFTLTDTNGTAWKLADLRGEVVFINFWATWCPPCRQELGSMEVLNREFADRPFRMITILVNDDPKQAANLAQRTKLTFPILIDSENKAAEVYGITGVPETFIIDPQGILREKVIGPRHWSSAESKAMITRYFPQ